MFENVQKKFASRVDPIGWGPAVASVAGRAVKNPQALATASTTYATRLARIPGAALRVFNEEDPNPPLPVDLCDKRFADSAWRENPAFFALRQSYFATRGLVDDLSAAGAGDVLQDAKARQFLNLFMDAVAPTNFPLTNPGVITRAFDTGGASLLRGARFAAHDIVKRKGQPVKVDRDAFTLGVNLAATPGKVVFRNELIEVIQYEPQTPTVHAIPILVSPPWINKYYILDLAPNRSLTEWAIKHGRTVFAISYRNPDESMMDVTMDDYFVQGFGAAMDVVEEVTGSPKIEVLSICLGGAIAAMAAARFAATRDERISALTMLNTLLDYSDVGELGLLVDPDTLDRVEIRMQKQGFLSGAEMADTFDMIKAKDLIFNYWVSRWMKGEKPTAFDILAWNEDSTRMPAKMHSQYLRSLYGRDELARGEYVLAGRQLDLGAITCDTYIVGAVNDHIVPWAASYKSVHLLGGDVRFVLTNGGHIAGAVNPPNSKSTFHSVGAPDSRDGRSLPSDPEEWRGQAEAHSGSWWEDWAVWSTERAGDLIAAPAIGSKKHAVVCDAPGAYVLQ
ncbi:PHA/PHB synthase family protein [Rhodococcus sp. T7]|uniref:PHA/PHB synthase family protein n=1 Tax=Rhodococcus sp. T7 TaxID=627444 RepID=UPI00135A8956|nr:alpha/beta fold hydrolase [Rhodococcus sp. T7]KAF0962649.1 Poly(3-hydroxyalkanoate) polymerase subunit PhaC [Rhodococcus sp. T7]